MAERAEEKLQRRGNTISATVLGETVVLDLDHDRYRRLNGSAGLLWERLERPASFDELVELLVAHYGIEEERSREDCRLLVDRLRAEGLLQEAGPAARGDRPAT